jgi:aminopeptidase YwaD
MLNTKWACLFAAIAPTVSFAQSTNCVAEKEHFKNDILFLANDALQGRVTGSPGEKMSAEFIASEFKDAGLTQLNGSPYQTFQIIQLRLATTKCDLSMSMGDRGMKAILNTDYYPISPTGNNDSCSSTLVDCGYGLYSDSLKRDDFAPLGKDIKGKIFIIRLGFPGDTEDPSNPLAKVADVNNKISSAMKYGPAGILFIPGSSSAEVPSGELKRNATTFPIPIFYMKRSMGPMPGMTITMKSIIATPKATGYNVLGYRNNHKKNTVIVCAHHDHLGYNEYGNSLYTGPQAIHNGADDNASGVAAMLQLARSLKGKKFKKNNYLFIAFSGEELGLIGSKFFTANPAISLKKINYVVNIDMLGRLDSVQRTLIINGVGTSPSWTKTLPKIKIDTGLIKITTTSSGLGPSDHASFYLENIPVLHFFSGQHSDYHKPSDDENKINYDGMCHSYDVIRQFIAVNNKSGKLTFTKTKDIAPGRSNFKVTLGVMPDYAFSGKGMRLDGVTEGKPAFKAGLIRGDIITKLGETDISGVEDYMRALGKLNKGEKAKVDFNRNGNAFSIIVEL